MTKVIETKYCKVCEYETPLAEVICIDILNDFSWTEPRCKPCFDDSPRLGRAIRLGRVSGT
jgi:hypothetical protein